MRLNPIMAVPLASLVAAALVSAQSSPPPCPAARIDTSGWVSVRAEDVGIELSRPAEDEEKRWESRSDTLGADVEFWRRAVNTIGFHEVRGFWADKAKAVPTQPNVTPCQLSTRSSVLTIYVERGKRYLSSGRDTVSLNMRATFTPPGKREILIDAGASDSTRLLEQLAILRTIQFITDR